ncbi:lipopolysaccharide biosynthesis protein [Spirosoma telluris]
MPELLAFLHKGDQLRTNSTFSAIWLVILLILAPAILIIQVFAPYFFVIWTQGQIPFQPGLFALLSISVMIYAWAQPPAAVVSGNNLVKAQFIISLLSSIAVLAGIFLLTPKVGILGAGIALVIAEILSALGFLIYAKKCMEQKQMKWPGNISILSFFPIVIVSIALYFIVEMPKYQWIVLLVAFIILVFNAKIYWENLPIVITNKANIIINNLLLRKQKIENVPVQTEDNL